MSSRFNPQSFESLLAGTLQRLLKGTPPNLAEAIRYSLLAPGKRIRPRLLIETAAAVGLDLESAMPAAVALEMIHCFTLIHDDLPCMDNDDFRRGIPSNHKVHGEALALLAGDALSVMAFSVILEAPSKVAPANLLAALRRLARCIGPTGVIGGQAAEMLLNEKSSLPELREMHSAKTGELFQAAVMIPADLAGLSGSRQQALESFGRALGAAFQVADDLDDARQDQMRAHASILAHLLPREASLSSSKDLENTLGALREHWPKGFEGWYDIAGRVIASLEAGSHA